ncbi:MAG: hypothetical protein PVG78_08455 [Desulfobacterales bacterium]
MPGPYTIRLETVERANRGLFAPDQHTDIEADLAAIAAARAAPFFAPKSDAWPPAQAFGR